MYNLYIFFTAKNLSCFPVGNSNDIAHYLEKGYKNRSIASTNMNEYSSRAHTIATIYLAQISTTEKSTLKSQINIVDLAGRYIYFHLSLLINYIYILNAVVHKSILCFVARDRVLDMFSRIKYTTL